MSILNLKRVKKRDKWGCHEKDISINIIKFDYTSWL